MTYIVLVGQVPRGIECLKVGGGKAYSRLRSSTRLRDLLTSSWGTMSIYTGQSRGPRRPGLGGGWTEREESSIVGVHSY